jgi:hypothetical protein
MRSGRDNGARRLVLGLLFLANLVVFTLVQLLAPFFPQLARDNYGATPFLTGGNRTHAFLSILSDL